MTVALSSLRVVTEGDSSSYVRSMADVASSSDKAAASVVNASSRFERLQRSLDPAYASQVRLAQAQNTLGSAVERGVISTDRYNSLMGLAAQRFDNVREKAGPLGKAFEGVSGQLIALSEGAGPVGVALAAFGPIGVAAAIGISVAIDAVKHLSEEANALGERSAKLKDFAETAGVTAVQLQVLEKAAGGVGVSTEKLEGAFVRFHVQLSELQLGQGNLYKQLKIVDKGLVDELSVTKDVAKAWDFLSEAYEKASASQKVLIERAVAGQRGGGGIGRVFSATAEAGGIAGLQAHINPIELISNEQRDSLGKIAIEIGQINAATKDIKANQYALEILELEKKVALYQQQIAIDAIEFNKRLQETGGWWKYILDTMSQVSEVQNNITDKEARNLGNAMIKGGQGTRLGASGGMPLPSNIYYPPSYDQSSNMQIQMPMPRGRPEQADPRFAINTEKERLSALGSAATAYEQLALKIKEVDLAEKDETLTEKEAGRARAALNLDAVIAKESSRIGLLGELVPVLEIVKQKEDQISAARQKYGNITDDEARKIRFLTQTQTEGARIQEKITAGVANETEIYDQLGKQLQVLIDKKLIDPTDTLQMASAQIVLGKSFKEMSEKAQLARAPLEQLKKWELDASNFRLQIDTASVSTLNQMTTSIVDFTTGTKTATAAFQDFGKSTIKILEELIVRMLLARALSPLIGGGGGGLPNIPGTIPAGALSGGLHGGGMTYEPTFMRAVDPAVFMNAPRAHSGIGPGEIPIIARRDEGIFTPGQMRAMAPAGSGNTQVNVYNQADNTSVKTSKRREGGVNITDVIISTVGKHMANGGFDAPLRARTGTQLQPRGR